MRKKIYILLLAAFLWSNISYSQSKPKEEINVSIDINNIINDKVTVTISPPKFDTQEVTYHIPKIVPGTYSEDNYGKFIENFSAFDKSGKIIPVVRIDDNTWNISNGKKISKITYDVNDTYDTETGKSFGNGDIFSPAGSNIDAGKIFIINTHCFVGYFENYLSNPYKLIITHPSTLWGATSMTDLDASNTIDIFENPRYAELVENPIMYSKPDFTTFNINGMEILIAVYSPNGYHTAESITPDMKKMMTAQKNFLGSFNSTKKYSVLIYLTDIRNEKEARGYGALEHPTSTTVVMPEAMGNNELGEQLKDVVSHEFFHIVTPLTIHSKEIQYFDFISPKMSKHLWMYEGVTEYFANLFQINQGLITEDEFYFRMSDKMINAATLNDTLSFTTMSANVLVKPYKEQYLNVYEKGALIAMCLDILIREKSNGEKGILNLMKELSNEYGVNKPFDDNELFEKITELTYPEVGQFLTKYVSGETPIPYGFYLEKVGVTKTKEKVYGNVFINDKTPFITVNPKNKEITVLPDIKTNVFYKEMGIQEGDVILTVNDISYNSDNVYDLIMTSQSWKNDDFITIKIKRNNKEQILKGKIKLPFEEIEVYQASDLSKSKLKEAWLKG